MFGNRLWLVALLASLCLVQAAGVRLAGGSILRRALKKGSSSKSKSSKCSKGKGGKKGSSSKSKGNSKGKGKGSCNESKNDSKSGGSGGGDDKKSESAQETVPGCADIMASSDSGRAEYVFDVVAGGDEDAQLRGDYVSAIVEDALVQDLADANCQRRRLALVGQSRVLAADDSGIIGFESDGASSKSESACTAVPEDTGLDCYRFSSIVVYYVDNSADKDTAKGLVMSGIPDAFGSLPARDVKFVRVTDLGFTSSVSAAQGNYSNAPKSIPVVGMVFIALAAVAVVVSAIFFVRYRRQRNDRLVAEIEKISREMTDDESQGDSSHDLAFVYGADDESALEVTPSVRRVGNFCVVPREAERMLTESCEVTLSGVPRPARKVRFSQRHDGSPYFMNVNH